MTCPRTDRIAALAAELDRLDPPLVLSARRAYLRARDDLASVLRRRQPLEVVEAHRYRVERAQDVLTVALHRPLTF